MAIHIKPQPLDHIHDHTLCEKCPRRLAKLTNEETSCFIKTRKLSYLSTTRGHKLILGCFVVGINESNTTSITNEFILDKLGQDFNYDIREDNEIYTN